MTLTYNHGNGGSRSRSDVRDFLTKPEQGDKLLPVQRHHNEQSHNRKHLKESVHMLFGWRYLASPIGVLTSPPMIREEDGPVHLLPTRPSRYAAMCHPPGRPLRRFPFQFVQCLVVKSLRIAFTGPRLLDNLCCYNFRKGITLSVI
jgi:hypothetical protein